MASRFQSTCRMRSGSQRHSAGASSRSSRMPAAAGSFAKTSSVSDAIRARSVIVRRGTAGRAYSRKRVTSSFRRAASRVTMSMSRDSSGARASPPRRSSIEPGHGRDRVAQLVGQAGRHPADVGQPLAPLHPLLHGTETGEVLEDDGAADGLPVAAPQREMGVAEPQPLTADVVEVGLVAAGLGLHPGEPPGGGLRPGPPRPRRPVICSPARFRKVMRSSASRVTSPAATDWTMASCSAVTAARSDSRASSFSPVRRSCSAR